MAEGPGPEGLEPGRMHPLDTPLHMLEALRRGETWHIPDLAAEPTLTASQQAAVSRGMRSWLVIPLRVEGAPSVPSA